MAATAPTAAPLQHWLRHLPGYERARVTSMVPVEGGASNVMCRAVLLDAPVAAVALRMERARGIFEPYNVVREGEVLRRLARSTIPVPALVGSERDPAVLGAPFIVMEWVDAPHMGVAGPEADFGAYVEMVARIHASDWRALGFAEAGTPTDAREAILRNIDAIAARMPGFGCDDDPLLLRACAALRDRVPSDGHLALCQGDINVFNYLFRDRKVAAVVDWEQAHIGDPRADMGQLIALIHLKGAPFGPVAGMPFLSAYEAVSGRTLNGMEYFRALWLFQLGVIFFGWTTFNDSEPWYTLPHLRELLTLALAELG